MRRGLPLVALLLVGCASFEAKPIDPVRTEASFRSRTLFDPGLRFYAEHSAASKTTTWPPAAFDLHALTLVAFYFSPDLEAGKARVAEADASILTAGGRPNPTVGIAPGYTDSPESPFLMDVTFDLPIETAGKRGHRIAQANALAEAARLGLSTTAWQVRSRVRAAFADHLLAGMRLTALRAEIATRSEAVSLLEARFAVGEVSRPEVDVARIALDNVKLLLPAAEGGVAETLAIIADAAGLPLSAVEGVKFEWVKLDRPPREADLPTLQRAGLLNRPDVRRTLSEYAAAEAALRLEVAKQYPDVHIGPGYAFDEESNKYTLGVSITLPLLNQNQGPIAEAEARRNDVAAKVLSLQAQVIGETNRALARYRAALAEMVEAEALLVTLREREGSVARAVEIGEEDRLALVGVRVERANAERLRVQALAKAQAALGSLEDAVQQPLGAEEAVPEIPCAARPEKSGEERKQ